MNDGSQIVGEAWFRFNVFPTPIHPIDGDIITNGYPILANLSAQKAYLQHNTDTDLVLLKKSKLIVYHPENHIMDVFIYKSMSTGLKYVVYLVNLLSTLLCEENGLLLHGAGFVKYGAATAVIGPSGAGKSTAAQLIGYDHLLSDDAVVISDIDGKPLLHATPLGGTTDGPMSGALKAIFFPRKSETFSMRLIQPREAIHRYILEHGDYMSKLFKPYVVQSFKNAHALFNRVPAYELSFPPDFVDQDQIRQILCQATP
jgi:hypothetical protein